MNTTRKELGTISLRDEELGIGFEGAPFWIEPDGISIYIDVWPNGIRTLLRIFVERMLPRGEVVWAGPDARRELVEACRAAHVPAASYASVQDGVEVV